MENKKWRNISLVLGTLIIIILFLKIKGCEGKGKKEYWEDPNFKPKIIKVPYPYPAKSPPNVITIPPHTVIQYLDNPNPNKVKCENDSLIRIIDSLGKSLALLNAKYLTQFSNSSKLVGGLFKLDTLKLDLLKTDGNIETQIYPTNYLKYSYLWKNDQLHANPINSSTIVPEKTREKLNQAFYVSGGYNFLNNKPLISADYYIRYRKFQLNVEPQITIEQNPTLELNGKIGYRLK